MLRLFVWWAVFALAIWIASKLVDGFKVKDLTGAIVVAGVFGALNWLLGGLLFGVGVVALAFLPLVVPAVSFVLHWLVSALLLWLTHKLTDKLELKSFGTALVAALVVAVLGVVGEHVVGLLL